jgi:hypothetical protein
LLVKAVSAKILGDAMSKTKRVIAIARDLRLVVDIDPVNML